MPQPPARPSARPIALRQVRRGIALAVGVLLLGGFSAHATLIAWQVAARERAADPSAQGGRPAGIAPAAAPGAMAAPAAGTTGTTALPDLPVPAGADLAGAGGTVTPARPFSMAGATPLDQARALQCLATAIYYEAASESEEGQRAVAQVILNRVRHPAFPASVCGVVYQGSDRSGCQFSYACDGSMARVPSRQAMARATLYAAEALAGRVVPSVGNATHYHTYAVTPSWNRTLVMTGVIGAHLFHRWKGYWGTPAAFRQAYSGNEPLPGPKSRGDAAAVAATAPVPVPTAPAARAPAVLVQAAYADSGLPRVAPATGGPNLPESTMLDKWAGTGQPLR